MKKDFDLWNQYKKDIEADHDNVLYQKRDIWWCRLGVNVGYEQDGTGKEFERPVVVLYGFSKQVCLVVPLTTSTKKNRYHISAGKVHGKDAYAITSQIRLIDTKRLFKKMGKIPQDTCIEIQKAIRKFFD